MDNKHDMERLTNRVIAEGIVSSLIKYPETLYVVDIKEILVKIEFTNGDIHKSTTDQESILDCIKARENLRSQ